MRYELSVYTPAQAATITGLTVAMQNDWRKRGFLKISAGHARFDFVDLIQMKIRKDLADQGLGPKASSGWALTPTIGIARRVLKHREAWEGFDALEQDTFSRWYHEIMRVRSEELGGGAGRFDFAFNDRGDFWIKFSDGKSSSVIQSLDKFFEDRPNGTSGGPYLVYDMHLAAKDFIMKVGPVARVVED